MSTQLVRWESTVGADDWERLQVRERTLPARKYLSAVEPLDEPQTWETDLTEVWKYEPGEGKKSMQVRLEEMLKVNPLDYEQKPFSDRTVPSVVDGKTTDGTVMNVRVPHPRNDCPSGGQNDLLTLAERAPCSRPAPPSACSDHVGAWPRSRDGEAEAEQRSHHVIPQGVGSGSAEHVRHRRQ